MKYTIATNLTRTKKKVNKKALTKGAVYSILKLILNYLFTTWSEHTIPRYVTKY